MRGTTNWIFFSVRCGRSPLAADVTGHSGAAAASPGAQAADRDARVSDATEQQTLDPADEPAARAMEQSTVGAMCQLPPVLSYDIAWDQIQGRRKTQQDCAVCIPMGIAQHLLVLADGMGGHAAGDIASSVAVTSFCGAFEAPGIPEEPNERLMAALESANYAIRDRISAAPELAGMGTTLVAVLVEGRALRWANVGDSPLWLIRDGGIRRLNSDHSVVGELAERIETGELTPAEAAMMPGGSLLLSALQGEDIELVDIPDAPERLEPGDVVVVASDGVETCGPEELIDLVGDSADLASATASRILAAVEDRQKVYQDNATLIVCRVLLSEDQVTSE